MSCNIRACKGSARSSCSIFSKSEFIWQYWQTCCFGKGRGSTETLSNFSCPSRYCQSQCTGTANQSQHITFFGRRAFIKPWTNRLVSVMLGRERGIVIRGINRMVRHDSIRYRFSYPAIRYCRYQSKIHFQVCYRNVINKCKITA